VRTLPILIKNFSSDIGTLGSTDFDFFQKVTFVVVVNCTPLCTEKSDCCNYCKLLARVPVSQLMPSFHHSVPVLS